MTSSIVSTKRLKLFRYSRSMRIVLRSSTKSGIFLSTFLRILREWRATCPRKQINYNKN